MISALQWFLFGMFVWGCCLLMSAVAERVTAGGASQGSKRQSRRHRWRRDWFGETEAEAEPQSENEARLEAELAQLRKRVETLETIVTDRKFQWEQELNR